MCFPPPIDKACASEDIYDLLIDESNREEIENNFRIENAIMQYQLEHLQNNCIPLIEEHIPPIQIPNNIETALISLFNELYDFMK